MGLTILVNSFLFFFFSSTLSVLSLLQMGVAVGEEAERDRAGERGAECRHGKRRASDERASGAWVGRCRGAWDMRSWGGGRAAAPGSGGASAAAGGGSGRGRSM